MSVESTGTASTHACGACQQPNPSSAKFCGGCGQSLIEPCSSCDKPVLLSQKFCGACGCDLQAAVTKKRELLQRKVAAAVSDAKEGQYSQALSALNQIVKQSDYRFAKVSEQAKSIIEKVRQLQERSQASAESLQKQATDAHEKKQHERVIELLGSVPDSEMTDESRKLLRESRVYVEQVTSLNEELQVALKAKNWKLLGGLVSQLSNLVPENPNYQQIAVKISHRLLENAKAKLSAGAFGEACEELEAIPENARTDEHLSLLNQVEGFQWLDQQLEREPLATQTLGRFGVRFAKESGDAKVKQRVQELAAAFKKASPGRHMYGPWKASTNCWMGGQFGVLGRYKKIGVAESAAPAVTKHAAEINVAVGLAIQGLGLARIDGTFFSPKKGILGGIGRRKGPASCWGVDIGAFGIRAVLLVKNDDGVELADVFHGLHESPLCRADVTNPDVVISDAIREFVSAKINDESDIPVWINLPNKEIVSRFVCIPPLKDKEAKQALESEIDQQIPLDKENLSVIRWLADLDDNVEGGRPAIIAASRKNAVDKRIETCKDAGLEISGMQCDAVSLMNLVAYEFAEELTAEGSDNPAIAMIDCGTASTTSMIVTARSSSMATFETGGEDLTAVISRRNKLTLAEADKTKQNPATLDDLPGHFAVLAEKMLMLRERLQRYVSQSRTKNQQFDIQEVWCVGGGGLCHSWARNVLSSDEPE